MTQEEKSVDQIVEELNKHHAVVMVRGKFTILNMVFDPTFNRPDVTFSSLYDFKNFYANRRISDSEISQTVADIWWKSPNRLTYKGIVFSPGQEVPGYYNLYRGLSYEPKKGDWSLFRNHILKVIANKDESIYYWILAWLARIVQDPGGELPGTSLVLRGKQGVGKGCFATEFGSLFGNHFLHICHQAQLVGKFNLHLKDCLVGFVDEGFLAGCKHAEGVIKALVTEETRMCEPKGVNAFAVKNHVNLIIASNHDWIIPAGLEERRFFVLDVADTHAQDHAYFAAIFDQMKNGGREAMLYDLIHMDISKFNLRVFPRTEALLDQIVHSMTTVQKFWYGCLSDGDISSDISGHWKTQIHCKELYGKYIDFAKDLGERYKLADKQFGKDLRKLCPEIVRRRISNGNSRPYAYFIPDLAICRQCFEKNVRMKIDWEN